MQPSRHILHFNGARLDTRNVVSAILNMYGYRILARLVQIATEYLPAFHCLQTSFLSFIGRHINKRATYNGVVIFDSECGVFWCHKDPSATSWFAAICPRS